MKDLTSLPEQVLALRTQPWQLGVHLDRHAPFTLQPWHLALHMAVLGASGSGKSKFLELLCRYSLLAWQGGMLIDPHSDLADELMAFVAYRKKIGDDALWRRIHFLEVSSSRAFAFDPFVRLPLRSSVSKLVYEQRLKTVVDRMRRTMLRRYQESDLDIMNRLSKHLEDALYACGVALDDKNTHIGLQKALAFCDPYHPEFESLLGRVFDKLPDYVQADFAKLRATRSEIVREKWESTINQFRRFLSPLLELVLTPSIRPSFDMREIIQKQEFVIARLGQTLDFSHDQKITVGGLLIDEVLNVREAEEGLPPEQRLPFTLILDESGEFLGEDLQRALKATRKYGLSIILAGQNLNSLVKGDLDLTAEVLSLCQTIVCFQQRFRQDKEILADRLGTGNIGFTKHMVRKQYQNGWIPIETEDHAVSASQSAAATTGNSSSTAHTRSSQDGVTDADAATWSTTRGSSQGESESRTWIPKRGEFGTTTTGKQRADSKSQMDGGSHSRALSHVSGHSLALSQGTNWNATQTDGSGVATTYKTTLLANIETEWEWNGSWEEGSVQDQREMQMQQLHGLDTAQAIVSARGEQFAVPVQIANVEEFWPHWQAKWEFTDHVKKLVLGQRPYGFSPEEEARKREQAMLAATAGAQSGASASGTTGATPAQSRRGKTMMDPVPGKKMPFQE